MPTFNSETENRTTIKLREEVIHTPGVTSRAILRSKGKGQGHWRRKCKNRFGAYFREKCIDSRKTKTRMAPIPCCTFRLIECGAKTSTFQDNRATMFDCANELFHVNGTSTQCRVAVKQTWRATCCVALLRHATTVVSHNGHR